MNTTHDSRGSLWHRWDLHFHTPSSFDYDDKSATNQQIVDRLVEEGVRVVAVTDHHRIDIDRIRELQRLGGDKLAVLPGIELRSDHGGKPINYICIFPEDCDLDHVWTMLQGSLGLTPTAISEKGGDHKVYVPIEQGAEITRRLGGVVSIHAGAKSNSIEGIENKEQFQQRIKYDITKNWVDLMEVGQLKDIHVHLRKIFPATGLDKPLIICSDDHEIANYSVKAPLWFRADPTFRGMLMVLREPHDRVSVDPHPREVVRVEQNPTKYVRSVSFQRKAGVLDQEHWFSGSVSFNTGLVTIIGNKGSGKSALADTIALLGSAKTAPDSFSFLNKDRFRHPIYGRAADFDATIEWMSGEKASRCLSDIISSGEVERVKYLPQGYVEEICNELDEPGKESFERELKSVIFSHVPKTQRLGYTTLDDLVFFQTGEKQRRIDSLLKQLREASRIRTLLESQADESSKRELMGKIERREMELTSHDKVKPPEQRDPASPEMSTANTELVQALGEAEIKRLTIIESINLVLSDLASGERRLAVAERLTERLDNFRKDYETFVQSLDEDAVELRVRVESLTSLSIDTRELEIIRSDTRTMIESLTRKLDGNDPPGLHQERERLEAEITELQSQLDAPNRGYQMYLKNLSEWRERRAKILGSENDPESLSGLKTRLQAFDRLPERIAEQRAVQTEIAVEIHSEKLAQADIYHKSYAAVQQFIDAYALATDKLKLEFRAELANTDFSGRLLSLLDQTRRGSFRGVNEGSARVVAMTEVTNWEDPTSVCVFLDRVDTALHFDQREESPPIVQLNDQLITGKTPEEVFGLVYGLEYIRPRYILRWEGKDLSMLSPGERGTLLLIFYLLVDKSDVPLIIDQPEGNLDNHTIAKILVDCIRMARAKRQVFIVTHNPNLAVVCDADQVVHASMDKEHGNAITYTTGSLENPAISQYVTDVLEGTRWAFGIRDGKYKVGEL